ncbi:UNVERIFIED_CONTAM: Actin-binding LIM protein 3 [Gekko kuhli]
MFTEGEEMYLTGLLTDLHDDTSHGAEIKINEACLTEEGLWVVKAGGLEVDSPALGQCIRQGSEVWHPICKQAARAEKKLKHRRTSETSISPPGSSIGSPNRVICAKVDNEILNYKDLAALPKIKAIYEVQRPDLISYEPYHRYTSDETLERYSYGEVQLLSTFVRGEGDQ